MANPTTAPAPKSRAQKLALIRDAFRRLEVLNKGWSSDYLDRYSELLQEEERGHRRWGSDFAKHHPGAASVADCARMFGVKRIAEYLNGDRMPHGKDYLHTQKSCFFAAGLVDEYREEIRKAWHGLDVAELAALDYVDLVRVKKEAA